MAAVHDTLRKMLKAPIFLDSSVLFDLRQLITEGVHKSDTLLLLATQGVLTRPWCLIELLETMRKRLPVVVVQMSNGGFKYEEARHFVSNLETEMQVINPTGLQLLHQLIGQDLTELKDACMGVLDFNENRRALIYNSATWGIDGNA